MRHHLAVLYRSFIDDILAGRKTVECQLGQIAPPAQNHLRPGDLIWLKQVSGPIRAVATARSVRTFDSLNAHMIKLIRRQWGAEIGAPPRFWRTRQSAKYCTLIWLGTVCAFEPFMIEKHDRRAWIVLEGPPVPEQIVRTSGQNAEKSRL